MSGALTAPIEVTNLQATGHGSLAAAIIEADAEHTRTAAPALITFATQLTGAIVLGPSSFPRITDAIEIDGPGARRLSVNAADYNLYRSVFDDTADSTLEISGLAVDDSSVYARHAAVSLDSDGFYDSFGSAVKSNHGSLTVRGCTFAGSYSHTGGAVRVDDDRRVVINDSTITGNSATTAGGVYARDSRVSLTGSTVSGNYASYTFPPGGTIRDPLLGYGGGIVAIGVDAARLDRRRQPADCLRQAWPPRSVPRRRRKSGCGVLADRERHRGSAWSQPDRHHRSERRPRAATQQRRSARNRAAVR